MSTPTWNSATARKLRERDELLAALKALVSKTRESALRSEAMYGGAIFPDVADMQALIARIEGEKR